MSRAEKVIDFYVLCNRLKDLIRKGWFVWHVKRDRLESVAEHVYGVQMMALVMYEEYDYDLDIAKVMVMLAVHELEEAAIGDIIPFEMAPEEKRVRGAEAVAKVLKKLDGGAEWVRDLIEEYEEQETAEAKFAKECDKLEADAQCWLYDREGCIDLAEQEGNAMLANEEVQEIAEGKESASEIWLEYNRRKNGYDENFLEVSRYMEGK